LVVAAPATVCSVASSSPETVVSPGRQIEVMRIVSKLVSPASAILPPASPLFAASSAAPTSSSLGFVGETGAEPTGAAAASAAQSTAMSTGEKRRIERSAGAVRRDGPGL
jgi:hypothetical protein